MPVKGVDPGRVPERMRAIFLHNPFAEHFDLEVISAEHGRAVLRFPFRGELAQYQGTLQGGIIVAYADAAMAVATASVIPEGSDFVTTDLTVQYVRSVTSGFATARGVVEHAGRTLVRARATVENDDGQIAAYCTCTCMIVDPRRPAGR